MKLLPLNITLSDICETVSHFLFVFFSRFLVIMSPIKKAGRPTVANSRKREKRKPKLCPKKMRKVNQEEIITAR